MAGDTGEPKSFYSKLENKYLPVAEDEKVQVVPFLDASQDSVIPLLDMLGSTAFAFVKSDVNGNISKLRKKYATNPEKYKTFHDMVEEEIENETTEAKNSATDALIWLLRGLHFICVFIKLLGEHPQDSEDLIPCLREGYDTALKRNHAWLIQKAVNLSFKAAPNYSDIIKLLSNGVTIDTLKVDINNYQQDLEANIQIIQKMYEDKKLSITPLK